MTRPRDSQRSKVYKWETGWLLGWDGPEIPLTECCKLVERVFKGFGYDTSPRIADGRGTHIARGGAFRISLPRWARRKPIVLHETTHALLARRNGCRFAAHGPEFVRLFIELLVRYNKEDRSELRRLARKDGLKVGARERTLALVRRGA